MKVVPKRESTSKPAFGTYLSPTCATQMQFVPVIDACRA